MDLQLVTMRKALENVYREHRQGLFSLAVSITGSHQLAEDSVQSAFASLFRRVVPTEDLTAYVFKTVRNTAIDTHRKRSRDARLNDSLINGYRPNYNDPTIPPDELLTQERHEILRHAIDTLSPEDREAVVLKSFAGLTFEQAGEITNIPPKTLATRYRRALRKLECKLKDKLSQEM